MLYENRGVFTVYSRISAVLITTVYPSNIPAASICLYHNPYASIPCVKLPWQVSQGNIVYGKLEVTKGADVGELIGISFKLAGREEMSELAFGQVKGLINNTCRAMDIRTIAIKSDSEWQCAVAIVRFTHRTVESVKNDQGEIKDRLGDVGGDRVSMLFDSLPISELESFIAKINKNHITVTGLDLTFTAIPKDIQSERLMQPSNIIENNSDSPYPYYEVMLLSDSEPRRLLEKAGVTGPSLGIRSLNDLQSWLGSNILGNVVVIVFVIPVYLQIHQPLYLKSNLIQARFSAHEWLWDRCRKIGMLQMGYNQSPIERKELALKDSTIVDDIMEGILASSFSLDTMYTDARVQFQFLDSEFGVLNECERLVTQMLSPG